MGDSERGCNLTLKQLDRLLERDLWIEEMHRLYLKPVEVLATSRNPSNKELAAARFQAADAAVKAKEGWKLVGRESNRAGWWREEA